jgi:hypothetical protein
MLVKNITIMEWPVCSSDLNPIKNMWEHHHAQSLCGRQAVQFKTRTLECYSSRTKEILAEVSKLTSSTRVGLMLVIM